LLAATLLHSRSVTGRQSEIAIVDGFRFGTRNPTSRPKGSRNKATLLADHISEERLFGNDKKADAIISKAIALAESGDTVLGSASTEPHRCVEIDPPVSRFRIWRKQKTR
jgi:hypothetical protein